MQFVKQHNLSVARFSRGMVSILFVAVVLPLTLMFLTVTVELSHFFGIRDELQKIVDREAYASLARGASEAEIKTGISERMRGISGMASITQVRVQGDRDRKFVGVSAQYSGAFFQLTQRLFGIDQEALPIAASSQVRLQSSAALVVFDRQIVDPIESCSSDDLGAIGSFVNRLSAVWQRTNSISLSVGVIPGSSQIVNLVNSPEQDGLQRCSNANGVGAIAGAMDPGHAPMDQALAIADLAINQLIQAAVESRVLVLVLRKERYDAGISLTVFDRLNQALIGTDLSINFITLVLDESGEIDYRPIVSGLQGGDYRELGVSRSELSGNKLISVVAQSLTDLVVIER